MRVYYDYQILLAQKFGGISRYIYELVTRLPNMGVNVDVECIHNHNFYFADRLGLHDMSNKNKFMRLSELGLFWYVNKFNARRSVRKNNYDIIHPTYYRVSYPERNNAKLSITVHDMTHEKYSGIYPRLKKNLITHKKRAVREADLLIAVSENTKRDLLEYVPDINPEKVHVIYHGFSMNRNSGDNADFSLMKGKDYILYVGDRRFYKNFARFIKAVINVMYIHKDLHLFCAGGGAFTSEELDSFGAYKSRIHQGGLSDSELSAAYQNALCYVFPSEYEGFGIPILESFACDCPVVCSDSSSLPEVAGSAAEYFSPVDVDIMTDKILNVIEHDSLRQELISCGRERVKLFSWDKAASQTLECYKLAKEV